MKTWVTDSPCERGTSRHCSIIEEGTMNEVAKVWCDGDQFSAEQGEANARLVGAAPDLLAALDSCMFALGGTRHGNPLHNEVWHQARAAYAKATQPNALLDGEEGERK